jgi:signal transduction histidine kinase
VTRTSGGAPPARKTLAAAGRFVRQARQSLPQVLVGRDQPAGPRWQLAWQHREVRAGLAVATVALCIVSVASLHPLPGQHELLPAWWHYLVAVVVVAPLPLAARYPLLAWRAGWLGLLLVPLVSAHWWGGWPWGPPQIVALLAVIGAVGVRNQRPVLWWAWGLTLIPLWLWLLADVPNLHGPIGATVVSTAVLIAVASASSRLHTQRALADLTARTEAERARRAVLEERTRIARELHDVVAHHMSLIAVQAETAPYRLTGLPEQTRAEFAALSGVAREALTEMRRLLGVLRQDQPAGLSPQPQLADLPVLVDAARRAGVAVQLDVPGSLSQVPSGVGLCAYRIVQESLSNASQHAPGAAVCVSVGQQADAVVLRVANGPGTPGPAAGARGAGHGLTGMRERVSLLGGSLSAGPAPDGGYVVSAVLPLGEPA